MFITRPAKEFRAILNATVPGYRKRNVWIQAAERVRLSGLNWDGGSRSSYAACTIDGQPLGNADKYHNPAPWNNPAEGADVALPPGTVIVKHGTFCGDTATAIIYVHPSNMPRLLHA